jgi:hypothetical protein
MRVVALCCAEFWESARRAAGVEPLLPPFPAALPRCDLLYVDLHGGPFAKFWFCRADPSAPPVAVLPAEQVRGWDLRPALRSTASAVLPQGGTGSRGSAVAGTVVFATSCYAWAERMPMVAAFLDAGARCVIGGSGENYEMPSRLAGAGLLGLWLRRWMQVGLGPERALGLARARLRLTRGKGARDAEGFRVMRG